MGSRKGIAVTIAILVGIIPLSFFIYLVPEDTTMKITVSDFEKHLDITKERATMESSSIDESFKKLMKNDMSQDEYIRIAEISSLQVNSLIIELTNSGATQEWTESYVNYIGALKKLSEMITETIVVASLMDSDDNSDSVNKIIAKIHQLETESLDLTKKSDAARP